MTHPLFTVSVQEIQLLNDEQARELVARLSQAEAEKIGAAKSTVTWGGDQRAKDGGIDVRFDADTIASAGTYIPTPKVGFQVKAEKFPPSKIPSEMTTKGILSESIKGLVETGNTYVIVSTRDSVSDTSLTARKQAMAKALVDAGVTNSGVLDFFDARRIADWVENFPSIVTWVKQAVGRAQTGWRPYGPWAYRESDEHAEYLLDDKVKVFSPGADEGIEVLETVNRLREDLATGTTVRLVGLSGVGKTRLVQALFDPRIVTGTPVLSKDAVIYADMSDHLDPQPTAMVEALVESGVKTYLVIDNCGQDSHKRLSEIVARSPAIVSLVTVEYDIRDDLPEGTSCYRLEGASDSLIRQLLERRYAHLSSNDIDRVTEFSDGNARVAFALANASEQKDELSQLTDDDLFRRLFHQKQVENDELLRCAEVASLLYSFDGEDLDGYGELEILGSLAEVSATTLYRNAAELMRRGLLQQRGKWRAVLPHAISNKLAARALENFPIAHLIRALLDGPSERIARSFSRRLGYLHNSAAAKAIVRSLLKAGGRLELLEDLDDVNREIFKNVAPVDPKSVLDALRRAVVRNKMTDLERFVVSDLVKITRAIAYDPELFDGALDVLLAFAPGEVGKDSGNSSHEAIATLFFCHLSGTMAPPEQRVRAVTSMLNASDSLFQELGLQSLGNALQTDHFSSHFEFDFGSRKRNYGWAPKQSQDVYEWYAGFVNVAFEAALKDGKVRSGVRKLLGEACRGLCRDAGMLDLLEEIAPKLADGGGWSEGWIGIRTLLHFDKTLIPADMLARLQLLEQRLAPRDLAATIRGEVLYKGVSSLDLIDDDEDSGGALTSYQKAYDRAEELGVLAASSPEVLKTIQRDILETDANEKTFRFCVGLGRASPSPRELLEALQAELVQQGASTRNFVPIRGFLKGWCSADPKATEVFLDYALSDDFWGPVFPELQCAVGLTENGFQRILRSLEHGLAPTWQYRYLSLGNVTAPLDTQSIATLISKLSNAPEGPPVALTILEMVIHSATEKGEAFVADVALVAHRFMCDVDLDSLNTNDTMADHQLQQTLRFILTKTEEEKKDTRLLDRVLVWERSKKRSYSYGRGSYLSSFFKFRPTQTLDAVYVPDNDGSYKTAIYLMRGRDADRDRRPMSDLPTQAALDWCRVSPHDRCLFIAETCSLFALKEDGTDTEKPHRFSAIAKSIFELASNKQKVLQLLTYRLLPMTWSGSRAQNFEKRLHVLDDLDRDRTGDEHRIISQERDRLSHILAEMERSESEEERTSMQSFE